MTTTDTNKITLPARLRTGLAAVALAAAGALVPGCGGSDSGGACYDGEIQTSWVLTQGGQVVECAPGDEVDMRVDDDNHIFTFNCSDHAGSVPSVPGGQTHVLSFALYDANSVLLSSTGDMSFFLPCGVSKATPQVEFPLP
ncbi:MAG TPA: hypothetical protein VHJ20_08750 [Polyangia bacterium]|nr:hypothetical protein [Polyangia bacterium]